MADKISAKEVKVIIANAMSERLGRVVEPENVEIAFREEEHTVGVFDDEHTETEVVFTGAKIKERRKK
jgi:hypothetical protein